MVPIICVLNHERISWVSNEIYYHDNFVFGHIFMFLTSICAHFCTLCTYLVGLSTRDARDTWDLGPIICHLPSLMVASSYFSHWRESDTRMGQNGNMPQLG